MPSNLSENTNLQRTTLIARRPILNRTNQLYGYELKTGEGVGASPTPNNNGSTNTLLQDVLEIGIRSMIGKGVAFITLENRLFTEYWDLLPENTHVVVRADNLTPDTSFLNAIERGKKRGLTCVIEDSQILDQPEMESLLPAVQIIRFSLENRDENWLEERTRRWQRHPAKRLVTHIATREQLKKCLALGIDYFEGNYLYEPEVIVAETTKNNRLGVLRLLAAIENPSSGPREVEMALRTDANLSYKLLRFVNSAYFGLRTKITSLAQATIYLGMNGIRQWISLLLLSGLDNSSPELIKVALIRARMCESLCKDSNKETQDMAFTVGLFSALDALLSIPMSVILESLPLPNPVRAALLREEGPFTAMLKDVLAFESGDWELLQPEQSQQCADAYLAAVEYAEQVESSLNS